MMLVNSSTPPSSCIASMRGSRASGRFAINRSTPNAATRPSAPPTIDRIKLSATIGRATSHRLAPSAARTAISRRRLESRASSRLAMFAQTISSRNPTAPISTISAGRDAPTSCSCAGITRAVQRSLLALYSAAMRPASTLISSCACGPLTPFAIRPTTVSDRARRDAPCRSFGSNASGVHTSTLVLVGNSNAGGITPTTVYGTASS
jgi:hypothetical protein